MNRCLELHDSILASVRGENGVLVLRMFAYVQESQGVPGVDFGTRWFEDGTLYVAGAGYPLQVELPEAISDGTIYKADGTTTSVIPLPDGFDDEVRLKLVFVGGSKWEFYGRPYSWFCSGDRYPAQSFGK